MKTLKSFLLLSLDGYFAKPDGDTSWAHGGNDPEFVEFSKKNSQGGATLLMGRKTYETMVAYWPTPQAKKDLPEVAQGMNESRKIVFSKTLTKSDWQNTEFRSGDLVKEVRKLKQEDDIVILGSASIVTKLTEAGLVDELQLVVHPVLLGRGQTMFAGATEPCELKLTKTRAFENGVIVSSYAPAKR
jgi:dihydrofolate reductase